MPKLRIGSFAMLAVVASILFPRTADLHAISLDEGWTGADWFGDAAAISCSSGVWGDVMGDDEVDVIDAQQLTRHSAGLSVAKPALVASQGDVSSDGKVNAIDAQQTMRYALGLSGGRAGTCVTSLMDPTNPRGDVTADLVNLGEPFYQNTYAKNPWDLQLYQGRLYVGHGNSSNEGPSGAGRDTFGDVWYLNLQSRSWVKEWDVPQDQIDTYRVFNGDLYMPGHDSGPGATGQDGFYLKRGGSWSKRPKRAIHVYDVYVYGNKTMLAVADNSGAAVRESTDDGWTYTQFSLAPLDPMHESGRAFSFFELGGSLYVSANHTFADMDPLTYRSSKIFRYTGSAWVHVPSSFFPGAPTDELRVARPVVFGNNTVYIGAMNYNDHQWQPYALYRATGPGSISRVSLPHGAKPTDLLVRGSDLFVLAYVKNGNGTFTSYVFTSQNASSFTEVLSFRNDGFARSFELDGYDFYFGIGDDGALSCNPKTLSCTWTDKTFASTTGDILTLR